MTTINKNAPKSAYAWRTVDLVTAAIIAAALGVAFWGYDLLIYPAVGAVTAFYPPIGELQVGVWILPAVVGMLLVRKPGAAIFAELIAANIELLLGNTWGITVLVSGLAQAAGVEIVFALLRYKSFSIRWAALGGAFSAVFEVFYEYYAWVPDYSFTNKLVYMLCSVISGAVISGFGGWAIIRGLAKTGALSAFAAGRESK
jgi:energy-coupling factor transport system substrate-specific component